jgi:transitional endoplasmic reticulum ATPase
MISHNKEIIMATVSRTQFKNSLAKHRLKNRGSAKYRISVEVPPIVQLWLLRMLVPLGGHREFISHHGFSSDTLAETIGLTGLTDPSSTDFSVQSARSMLRKLHLEAERMLANATPPTCLSGNIARLATLVGLNDTDRRILEFAVMIQSEQLLEIAADLLGQLSSVKVFHALSILLDLPATEIRASLNPQALLAKSGLVSVCRHGVSNLRHKLDLLSNNFADNVFSNDADPVTLLRDTVVIGSAAHLTIADYEHISPSLSVLCPYLKQSIAGGRKGVNIFLHGAPGTGKSQLAKVLASALDCEIFEITSEDEEGNSVDGERRLRAYRAAQSFFAQRRALLVFDEVEDIFNDGNCMFGQRSTAQGRKAWINRMLEENSVPTLWLSNSIAGLDPAFIRRFDMVFELSVPPKKQRARIIEDACADLLDAPTVARFAEVEALAPAVVTRAASVVRSISDELGPSSSTSAFELLINNTLEAQGHRPTRKNDPNRLPDIYDPSFINADTDLTSVANGLIQAKSGRLCLYGPPGTGKTAYGRWLSQQMDVPLLVKCASDLMSMWVGENEKNIARAFKQAEQEGAVLLIDEVDSFLQDRRGAERGWEVSLVNEMLTQMESFSGVFIASTNLMTGLDQAALRRFDMKVKFDFLKPEQACELMRRYCVKLSIQLPRSADLAKIMHMQKLTPGDFAAIARQNRFHPIASTAELLSALEAECALKEDGKLSIGFNQ